MLADNCPGPSMVSLSVRDELLWEIQVIPGDSSVQQDSNDLTSEPVEVAEPTAIIEFIVGQTPNGWTETTPLTAELEVGIRYTISTQPDGQTIDFATPDLQPGLLWDGTGVIQFNPNLINEDCSDPVDFGLFAQNILALVALGAVASALVLVALITLLFVITRRFSRVRSIQRKSQHPRL